MQDASGYMVVQFHQTHVDSVGKLPITLQHPEKSEKLLRRVSVPGRNPLCSSSTSGFTIEQTLLCSLERIKHLGPRALLLLCYRSCSSRQIRQVTCALSERDTEPQLPVRPLETDASLSLVDKTRTARRQRCHPAGIGLPTEAGAELISDLGQRRSH